MSAVASFGSEPSFSGVVPIGTPVRLEGRMLKRKGRLVQLEGRVIRQDTDATVAQASGSFMTD